VIQGKALDKPGNGLDGIPLPISTPGWDVAPYAMLPMQPGDVRATCADVDALQKAVGFAPNTPVADGIARFIDWYRGYHRV
jgi:nucleoside-diphosphate-sugar epimerase